jgi:hypothetical protein
MTFIATSSDDDQHSITLIWNNRETGEDYSITVFRSNLDDVPVVQIDTNGDGERFRININEAPVWDGNPEKDSLPGAYLRESA